MNHDIICVLNLYIIDILCLLIFLLGLVLLKNYKLPLLMMLIRQVMGKEMVRAQHAEGRFS